MSNVGAASHEGVAPGEGAEPGEDGPPGEGDVTPRSGPPGAPRPRIAPSAPRGGGRVLLDPPLDASGVPPTPPRRRRAPFRLPRIRAPRAAFAVTAGLAALLAAMTRLGEPLRTALDPGGPPPLSALRPAPSGEGLVAGSASARAPEAKAPAAEAGPWRIDELARDPHLRLVRGKLGQSSLVDALEAAKVPKAQIYRILKAFADSKRFDRPRKNDAFAVAVERAGGRVRAFEYQASVSDVWQAREDEGGKLVGHKLDLRVEQRRVARAVLVRDDLKSAVVEAGFDDDLLDALDDALDDRVALTSLHRGAVLRIVAQEQTVLGKFARYVDVEAVEYLPPARGAAPVRVYHYKNGKAAGYYDGRGRAPYQGGWRFPLRFPRVTSRFNPKRMHPVLHRVMPHNGCDFGGATGTPVYAAARGTVDFVGNHGPSGNLVVVDHGGGTQTGYAHLSRFAPGIKPGDKVETRQLVGYVGSTGRSTAPHLHFSLKKNGVFVDPLTLKMDGERVLPPSDREPFDELRRQLDAVLDGIALPERPRDVEPEIEAPDEPAGEEADEGPAAEPAAAAPAPAPPPPAAAAAPPAAAATPPPAAPAAAAPNGAEPSVDSAVWRPKLD
ncbi:MAG TPA: M23 family metallopeptidase [Polyangiaceae bacterium]|nr:M23 family metallopeptidase [Polyangiaceae bacterium]